MTNVALAKVEPDESRALARAEDSDGVDELLARFEKIKRVQRAAMVEGVHFGKVPGTDKPALLKPGAEMLCLLFHLDPQFKTEESWDGEHLECVVTCTLYNAQTEKRLGSGIGSCSTKESKYAWRKAQRVCPKCEAPAVFKSKFDDGWYCNAKAGGCGAKFRKNDEAITDQKTGRVPNPDLPDIYNTVRKMACKRAHVAASLFVTGGSALFTQDVEENVQEDPDKPPPTDPHDLGDDASGPGPKADPAIFKKLKAELDALEAKVDTCETYDMALSLRDWLGSAAKPSALTKTIQRERAAQQLDAEQHKELSKVWQRTNRKLAKLETSLKPDVTASFADDEPEQGDTGELSEEQEREMF